MPRPTNAEVFKALAALQERLTDISARCSLAESRAEEAHARLQAAGLYVRRMRVELRDQLALHAEQMNERLAIATESSFA